MGDADQPGVGGDEVADHPEQRLGLTDGQCRRGFVHHEDAGVVGQRPRDLDHLLAGHGEVPDPDGRVEVHPEALEEFDGIAAQFGVVHPARPVAALTAEVQVLRHGQVGDHVQLLVDDGQAQFPGVVHATHHDAAALEPDLTPGVGDAGEDLHQRRLSRTVLATGRAPLLP